jgi:hypothetical protein
MKHMRQKTIFLIIALLLTGAGIFRLMALLRPGRYGELLLSLQPVTVLWFATSVAGVGTAVVGSYRAMQTNRLWNRPLRAWLLVYSISFSTLDTHIPWQAFDLSINFSFGGFSIGPNFVGLALLIWCSRIGTIEQQEYTWVQDLPPVGVP